MVDGMFYELEFEKQSFEKPFDTAYGVIKIPENMIFYRGYSTRYPALTERFAYFSDKKIASAYVKTSDYTLSAFTNTRVLRVLDVRFMMSILREMIYSNKEDESSLPVVLSFGLCSLRHQVALMNIRYRSPGSRVKGHDAMQKIVDGLDPSSPFEPQGVRVGETTNDAYTMAFLSVLFENFVDGFVSPRLSSPYFVDNKNQMPPELILFNPIRSGIRKLSDFPPPNIPKYSMYSIYAMQTKHHILRYLNNLSGYISYSSFHLQAGGGDGSNKIKLDVEYEIPSVENINERWNDDEIQTAIKNGACAAEKWKQIVCFGHQELPVPTLTVSPWTVPTPRKHQTRKLHKIPAAAAVFFANIPR